LHWATSKSASPWPPQLIRTLESAEEITKTLVRVISMELGLLAYRGHGALRLELAPSDFTRFDQERDNLVARANALDMVSKSITEIQDMIREKIASAAQCVLPNPVPSSQIALVSALTADTGVEDHSTSSLGGKKRRKLSMHNETASQQLISEANPPPIRVITSECDLERLVSLKLRRRPMNRYKVPLLLSQTSTCD
jgi:hypothetical protein